MTEHDRDEQPVDDARALRTELRRFVRDHDIRTHLRAPRTHREIALFREAISERWADTEASGDGGDGE